MSSDTPPNDSQAQLEAQLRAAIGQALPAAGPAESDALVRLLADLVAGKTTPDEARASIGGAPGVAALLGGLAGQELALGGSLISFGAGSQLGDVSIGDVAGGDILKLSLAVQQTLVAAEAAYDVRGLPNPYLGLRAFTYEDRASFAGRERLVAATAEALTAPGAQRALLFVTGASGSGKSSFAQAGLLPALEAFYAARGLGVRRAVMRPGPLPLAALADALLQLGLPADGPFAAARPFMVGVPRAAPVEGAIGLLVIDQFEELFSPQCDPAQRDALFAMLAELPPFASLRAHLIATMRADYLPDLFARRDLYEVAKAGVDLRAMSADELRSAIMRPLQRALPDKRIEPALLDRLAEEAAADAAYLPLLQVSLEDLFRSGSLAPARHHSLADALRARADAVQDFVDYDGERRRPRPPEDRAIIMAICLDLVRVSLDDDPRRDVRRRQPLASLLRGAAPELERRRRLAGELVGARLLSASAELPEGADISADDVEVDIIHESLIARWDRLRAAVAERRDALQEGERFSQALAEWREHLGQTDADQYLLAGVRLAEAEALRARDDVALRQEGAAELLARSLRARDDSRRRQLRRTRIVAGALGALALLALVAAAFAIDRQRAADSSAVLFATSAALAQANAATAEAERERADQQTRSVERQARLARAGELASEARLGSAGERQRSALLAVEAFRQLGPDDPLPASVSQALYETAGATSDRWFSAGAELSDAELSADGSTLVTVDPTGAGAAWDLSAPPGPSGAWPPVLRRLQLPVPALASGLDVIRLHLSDDGSLLLTIRGGFPAQLWDLRGPGPNLAPIFELPSGSQLRPHVLSGDGSTLAAVYGDNTIAVWRIGADRRPGEPQILPYEYDAQRVFLRLSEDGRTMAAADTTGRILIWQGDWGEPRVLAASGQPANLLLGADGRYLLAWYEGSDAEVWDLGADAPGEAVSRLPSSALVNPLVVALGADPPRVAAADGERGILLWDLAGEAPTLLSTISTGVERSSYTMLRLGRDGRRLIGATSDGSIAVWDVSGQLDVLGAPASLQAVLRGHEESLSLLALADDGGRLVTSDGAGNVRLWDLDAPLFQRPDRALELPEATAADLMIDDDRPVLVEAGENGAVSYRDPDSGREVAPPQRFDLGPGRIVQMAASGRAVAVLLDDLTLRVARDGELETVTELAYYEYDLAISEDARVVVAISATGGQSALCVRAEDGYRCESPQVGQGVPDDFENIPWTGDLSADGGALALATANGITVQRLSAEGSVTDSLSLAIPDGAGSLFALALSADGRRLAAVTSYALLVWHLDESNPAVSVRRLEGSFDVMGKIYLAAAEGGQSLAHRAEDGHVDLWAFDAQGLADQICRAATRNLSLDEWRQYFGGEPYRRTCPALPDGTGTL